MDYSNAKKGIKTIYTSVVFAIIAALLGAGTSLLLEILSLISETMNEFASSIFGVISLLFCFIISLIMLSITSLLGCVGYYRASKDEEEFKKALICALAGGALTFIGTIFQVPNSTVYTILTASGTIVETFVMVFAVTGLINICERFERQDLAAKGDMLLKILVFLYIISAINAIIIRLFNHVMHTKIFAIITGTLDLALSITQYILFLKYLKQTGAMLDGTETGETVI